MPLLPVMLLFWGIVLAFSFRKMRQAGPARDTFCLLGGITGVVLAAFIFTPFGLDPSGRYFLPVEIALAFFAAAWIGSTQFKRKLYPAGLLGLVIVLT